MLQTRRFPRVGKTSHLRGDRPKPASNRLLGERIVGTVQETRLEARQVGESETTRLARTALRLAVGRAGSSGLGVRARREACVGEQATVSSDV